MEHDETVLGMLKAICDQMQKNAKMLEEFIKQMEKRDKTLWEKLTGK